MSDPLNTSAARKRVLARIRAAQGRAEPTVHDEQRNAQYLAQHPRGPQPKPYDDAMATFVQRARLMASTLDNVAALDLVPAACARYLANEQLTRDAACWNTLASLDWIGAGIQAEFRPPVESDLVGITGSFCAIAETGTLLLLSAPDTPPTTHLWPETHIAIVERARIVPTMEDAFDLVRYECGDLPYATNFVSGPSRTADIEQTVVLGAHGPYRVHIIIIDV